MVDIETPREDAAEQEQGLAVGSDAVELDVEAPDADAAEQFADVRPAVDRDAILAAPVDPEADAADVADQRHVVEYDDDDEYR